MESNVVKLVTEEQRILDQFKPCTKEDFNSVDEFDEEDIRIFNTNNLVEMLVGLATSDFLGDAGKEISVESFMKFQMKVARAASELIESCQRVKGNK